MKEKILIVESSKDDRLFLNNVFYGNYSILETTNGQEALEMLRGDHKDTAVILLDLALDDMDGFEFIQICKKDPLLSDIPILIITGSNGIQDQVRGYALGAEEFITKPITSEIVELRVKHVLNNKKYIRNMEKEMERLKAKSETDAMTGLPSKVSAEESIDEILESSQGTLAVLLVIDIDYFKIVNDTLGHQMGDNVIKCISKLLYNFVRQSDIVGRIGGDEFCVLLRDIPDMEVVYAKLRDLMQIMKYKIDLPIPEYVTLSIGVATNQNCNTTYAHLFNKADEALYQAKNNGRAQFCEFGMKPQLQVKLSRPLEEPQQKEKKKMILVVDDEPVSRMILRNVLETDYEVLEAENGLDAMHIIHKYEERIMAVVLDLFMPIMNGYQVLNELKRNNNLKDLPVIICTSENSEMAEVKSLNMGVNLIIHKPISPIVVHKYIDNIVATYEDKKNAAKQYMLQKNLMGNRSNAFMCVYNFSEKKVEIGENYLKYIGEDLVKVFDDYPFNMDHLVLPSDYQMIHEFFDVLSNDKTHEEIEVRIKGINMYYEWFEINKVVNYDNDNNVESVIFMFMYIQPAVEAKNDLLFLASKDSLTHIPNVRVFTQDVENVLQQHPQEEFVMITMDIFQFKLVNRIYGHKEGDSVLKYLATKLQEIVEDYSIGLCCRASMDIFYICLSGRENVAEFMQMMQQVMYYYHLSFKVKLCFGIYKITNREESVGSMIEHASFALRGAKKAPVRTFCYYDEALKKKERFEVVAVAEMEDALKSQQFEVYYQPKYNIVTNEIIGAEALIRWNHPKQGYLSPAYFIPILEQNGSCIEVDYYVYAQVCKSLRGRLDRGEKVVPVSVNVSRWSLYNENLMKNILQIVEKYQVPHQYIEFEITESAFVLETNLLTTFSKSMRERGFKILLDDFGSGYSSLNSLKDIVVDILKIDIKFLPVNSDDKNAEIILSSVIEMGKKLGLGIVAEGVENAQQVKMLKALGCQCVQGFYFFRPMPYPDYQHILNNSKVIQLAE